MYLFYIKNNRKTYKVGDLTQDALKGVSLSFRESEFVAILGHSGSGKTTLLSIISGLDFAKSGDIYFKDKEITRKNISAFRRNDVSIVFQQYNLINYLTAFENVMLAMTETDNKLPKDKAAIAYNLLDRFGIVKTKADRLVGQLSGGEQQRVSIARALASNVDLIFADEPTGNLDTATEEEIIDIFKQLAHDFGKTIIVVTHSNAVSEMSDQRVLLKDGQLHRI